jgi:hypothetical protein
MKSHPTARVAADNYEGHIRISDHARCTLQLHDVPHDGTLGSNISHRRFDHELGVERRGSDCESIVGLGGQIALRARARMKAARPLLIR